MVQKGKGAPRKRNTLQSLFISFLLITQNLNPALSQIVDNSFGQNVGDFDPSLVLVSVQDYNQLGFKLTNGKFVPSKATNGSVVNFRGATGVSGDFISFTENDTISVDVGTKRLNMGFKVIGYTPYGSTLVIIHSDFPVKNTGDHFIKQARQAYDAGQTPVVGEVFSGIDANIFYKRNAKNSNSNNKARYPTSDSSEVEVGENDPQNLMSTLNPKTGVHGARTYIQVEGDFYAHYARSVGLGEHLELVKDIPVKHDYLKTSHQDSKNMPTSSRPVQHAYWRLAGMGDHIAEHSSERPAQPVIKRHGNEGTSQKFPKLDRQDVKRTVVTGQNLWPSTSDAIKKAMDANGPFKVTGRSVVKDPSQPKSPFLKDRGTTTKYYVRSALVDRLNKFIDGKFLMAPLENESVGDLVDRTARNIIKDFASGILAGQASQGDVIRQVGGECNNLNFISGALGATIDACQFQAIELLGSSILDNKKAIDDLKVVVGDVIDGVIQLGDAVKQTNEAVRGLDNRINLNEDMINSLANAQLDDQYRFADMTSALSKTSAAITQGSLIQARTDASVASLAKVQEIQNNNFRQSFSSQGILVQEQYTLLTNSIRQQKAASAAIATDSFAKVMLEMVRLKVDTVRAIAESHVDNNVLAARNAKDLISVTTVLQATVRNILASLDFHTTEIKDLRTLTSSIGQLITGVGNAAAEYYIFTDILQSHTITDVLADGTLINSRFKMLVFNNSGIRPQDQESLTAQEFTKVHLAYLDTDLINTCLASQLSTFVNYMSSAMAEHVILQLEAPFSALPEYIQDSYVPIPVSGPALQAPVFIPSQNPSYYLVGVFGSNSVYLYFDGLGLSATTTQSVANQWSLGVSYSRSLQDDDCVRSLAAVTLSVTGSNQYYLSWTNSSQLVISTTSVSNTFMIEPTNSNFTNPKFSAAQRQDARNNAYSKVTEVKQNTPLWFNPITVSKIQDLVNSPLDVLGLAPPSLSLGSTIFDYFKLVLSGSPALNDTGIIEIPITEAERNSTGSPIRIAVRHFNQDNIDEKKTQKAVASAKKKRDFTSGQNLEYAAPFDVCYTAGGGIIEDVTFYSSGPQITNGPAALRNQRDSCLINDGCAHYQGVAEHVLNVYYTDGSIASFTGTFSTSADGLALISAMVSSPHLSLNSLTTTSGTQGNAGNNFHCASATANCAYVIPVLTCSGSGNCVQRANTAQSTNPTGWAEDTALSSGLANSLERQLCPPNPPSFFCTYSETRSYNTGSFFNPQGATSSTSPLGLALSTCKLLENIGGRIGENTPSGWNTNSRGNPAGSMDSMIGDNVNGNGANVVRPVLRNFICKNCQSGYGSGQGTTPVFGKAHTTDACPLNSGVGNILIGDHTGTYFVNGTGQPSGAFGATFTIKPVNNQAVFWSACLPVDRDLIDPAATTVTTKPLSLTNFFGIGDTGGRRFNTTWSVKFSTMRCNVYNVASCISNAMLSGLCTTRVSTNYSIPLVTLGGYVQECVSTSVPSRCANFTTGSDCINYAEPNLSGVPIYPCGWTGSSCRELSATADATRAATTPFPTLSVACSERQKSLDNCASDGLCMQHYPGFDRPPVCVPVKNSLVLQTSNWTTPTNQTDAYNRLIALNMSISSPRSCLETTVYCTFSDPLLTLRLGELLYVAYPDIPIDCGAINKVSDFDNCLFKHVVPRPADHTAFAPDTPSHEAEDFISYCKYRPGTIQCSNKCSLLGKDKNVVGCFSNDICLEDQATLTCFDTLNSGTYCPGRAATRTAPDSECLGKENFCNGFSAINLPDGTPGNFTVRADYLNSQCVQVAGRYCGTYSNYNLDPRLANATLPDYSHSCVVLLRDEGPICYPTSLVPWCGFTSTTCGDDTDVCTLDNQADIDEEMNRFVKQEYCELLSASECLLARRKNVTEPRCVLVEVSTDFSYCTSKQEAANKFGTLDPSEVTIYTDSSFAKKFGSVSVKMNVTLNQATRIGIVPANIVIPPAGVDIDFNDPLYKGKVLVIGRHSATCPDPDNWVVKGQMCCPRSSGDSCTEDVAIQNPHHWKYLYTDAVHQFCPTLRVKRTNEVVYNSCQNQRYASATDDVPKVYYSCKRMVLPSLANLMFEFTQSTSANEIVVLAGGSFNDTPLGVPMVPLDDYSKGVVVGNFTYSVGSTIWGAGPTTYIKPIYSSAIEATPRPLTGVTVNFVGVDFVFDTILNITATSQNIVLKNDFGLLDITDDVTARTGTGWTINSLTGGTAFQKMLKKTSDAYLSSQERLFGPYPPAFNSRIPAGCISEFQGPQTTTGGDFTPKSNVFFCLAVTEDLVPIYEVVSIDITYTASLRRSDNGGKSEAPVSITISEPIDPNIMKKGDMFIFQQRSTTQVGVKVNELGVPFAPGYIVYRNKDDTPEEVIDTAGNFHPRFGVNSPQQYQVPRDPNAPKWSFSDLCGQTVTANGDLSNPTLAALKSMFRYDYFKNLALTDPTFSIDVMPIWDELLVDENVGEVSQIFAIFQDEFNLQCSRKLVNWRESGLGGTDVFTYLLVNTYNSTDGSIDRVQLKRIMQRFSAGQDHIQCGNCLLKKDPITNEFVYNPNDNTVNPKGCNPYYGTTLAPELIDGSYIVDSWAALNMPFCYLAFSYNITSLVLTDTDGSLEADVLPGIAIADLTFITAPVGQLIQTGVFDQCGIVVNGSAPIVGTGVIVYTIANPVNEVIEVTLVLTNTPPNATTGVLNTTLVTGDSDNKQINIQVPKLSSVPVTINIPAGVHYVQLFTRSLSSSCSDAFSSNINYQSTFLNNSQFIQRVSLEFGTDILSNIQIDSINLLDSFESLRNNFTLQIQGIGSSIFTLDTDVTSITGALGGIIVTLNNQTQFTEGQFVFINTTVIPQLQNLTDTVGNNSIALGVVKDFTDGLATLITSIGTSSSVGLATLSNQLITAQAASAAFEADALARLDASDTTVNGVQVNMTLAQAALAAIVTSDSFFRLPAGAQLLTNDVWIAVGAAVAGLAGAIGTALGIWALVRSYKIVPIPIESRLSALEEFMNQHAGQLPQYQAVQSQITQYPQQQQQQQIPQQQYIQQQQQQYPTQQQYPQQQYPQQQQQQYPTQQQQTAPVQQQQQHTIPVQQQQQQPVGQQMNYPPSAFLVGSGETWGLDILTPYGGGSTEIKFD